MNSDQAKALINAINAVYPFVPPMFYSAITSNPMMSTLTAVANGALELQAAPPKPREDNK